MGTRREFLAGATGLAATIAAGGCAASSRPGVATRRRAMFAYVGCYTSKERNGHGEGISTYRIDAKSGEWTPEQVLKGAVNPSWLTVDRQRRCLYTAHGDGTETMAYSIDPDSGRLALLNRQPTKGRNGVRLGIDASNTFAVIANYASGTVAVLPIKADGALGAVTDVFTLRGKPGPHRTEQTSSHPHDVVFEPRGRFLVVPDKGFDATFVFRLDAARGKLVPAGSVASRPGAGPRHADFHPLKPYLYQINELDSTITTFKIDIERSELNPLQTITTLPSGFTGTSTTAEIAVAPSGRFVYGSNRGHDSIAIFAVDDATGTLSSVGSESTQGRSPRFFALDPSGAFLYAANQNSDTIVAFSVDQPTGRLKPTGQVVKTGSPSSIVFR